MESVLHAKGSVILFNHSSCTCYKVQPDPWPLFTIEITAWTKTLLKIHPQSSDWTKRSCSTKMRSFFWFLSFFCLSASSLLAHVDYVELDLLFILLLPLKSVYCCTGKYMKPISRLLNVFFFYLYIHNCTDGYFFKKNYGTFCFR